MNIDEAVVLMTGAFLTHRGHAVAGLGAGRHVHLRLNVDVR
jgi:hypothetical protein